MSGLGEVCTERAPGTRCSPTRHHPECRYAGTEPKVQRYRENSLRLIAPLAALCAEVDSASTQGERT